MIYSLTKLNNEGTLLHPTSTYYSDEYAEEMCRLYLTDELVFDEKKEHYIKNYRLHAMKPHNIEMALSYDILCPRCERRMKQIGRCLDSHKLGLYTCKECNKH